LIDTLKSALNDPIVLVFLFCLGVMAFFHYMSKGGNL